MKPTTRGAAYNAAYQAALDAGKSQSEAVLAGIDAADEWSPPADPTPEPEPEPDPAPTGDILLEAADKHDREAELTARRARGARALLEERGGPTTGLTDEQVLAALDRAAEKRAARDEANDLDANAAAAAWPTEDES